MITLDLLKTYLGITGTDQDTLLALFVNSANGKIKSVLGYDPIDQDYTKKINGNAQSSIIIKEKPINTITSLKEYNGTTYELVDGDYWFEPIGIIHLDFILSRGFENYELIFNAGYASDSVEMSEINMIALQYASMLYSSRGSNGVRSESVSGDEIVRDVAGFDFTGLNKYRDVF